MFKSHFLRVHILTCFDLSRENLILSFGMEILLIFIVEWCWKRRIKTEAVLASSSSVLGSDRIAQLLAVIWEAPGYPRAPKRFRKLLETVEICSSRDTAMLRGDWGSEPLALRHASHPGAPGNGARTSECLGCVRVVKNACSSQILSHGDWFQPKCSLDIPSFETAYG